MDEQNTQPAVTDLIKQTEITIASLKAENDRKEVLLKQEQELYARKLLGGNSQGGITQPPIKEETPQEYAKRILSGKL